jgi:serine/threonine-protein kinase RsbW
LKVLPKIKIEVPSELTSLNRVLLQFDRVYQHSLSERDWLQCQLALAEGFTNAVRHAHKNLSSEVPIEIEITLTERTLEIRIWDRGGAFDLKGFISKILGDRKNWLNRARGITIINRIADRLDYYRTSQGKNCLLIVKQLSSKDN